MEFQKTIENYGKSIISNIIKTNTMIQKINETQIKIVKKMNEAKSNLSLSIIKINFYKNDIDEATLFLRDAALLLEKILNKKGSEICLKK